MTTNESHTPRPGLRLTGGLLLLLGVLLMVVGVVRAADSAQPGDAAPSGAKSTTALPLPTNRDDFFFPGTQPEHPGFVEILDPANCDSCHTDPIFKAWRGSMMGQAGRDPLFWAAFNVAGNDASDAGEFCLRCHAPRGWFAGRSDPADGSAMTDVDIDAGLACEVCHRMVDPVPGAQDEATAIDIAIRDELNVLPPTNHVASAMIILDPQDRRRGPFARPINPHPVLQTKFLGQGVNAVTESRLCGSCHNVDNPLLSWNDDPPGNAPAQYWPNAYGEAAPSFDKGQLFPLERTYDEWLNSSYAKGGVFAPQFAGAMPSAIIESCQDCHMTRQTGYAAESFGGPTYRNCNTTGCLPAHVFVGGNTWIPRILQDTRWRLRDPLDAPALNATAAEAESMLRRAATLQLTLEPAGAQQRATVRVINETGHKLPTGYPEGRRMWLNLRAYNAAGQLIYESGAYNLTTGQLTEDTAIKVYEAKQGLTPQLAAVAGVPAGPSFHFALNNTTYKDNRIPPRGYTVVAFDQPGLRPVGATYADGQYWDDTQYTVPAATVRFVATLYYQTASSEYIDFLRELGETDGATLGLMWDDDKSPPVAVDQVTFPAPNESFIPMTRRQ
jgi:hypothetical protein